MKISLIDQCQVSTLACQSVEFFMKCAKGNRIKNSLLEIATYHQGSFLIKNIDEIIKLEQATFNKIKK